MIMKGNRQQWEREEKERSREQWREVERSREKREERREKREREERREKREERREKRRRERREKREERRNEKKRSRKRSMRERESTYNNYSIKVARVAIAIYIRSCKGDSCGSNDQQSGRSEISTGHSANISTEGSQTCIDQWRASNKSQN